MRIILAVENWNAGNVELKGGSLRVEKLGENSSDFTAPRFCVDEVERREQHSERRMKCVVIARCERKLRSLILATLSRLWCCEAS